jgi:hypothetical protein
MMLGQEGRPIPVTEWTLRYDGYSPREEGLREALCATGNGYFATRGAAPESAADGTHYPGSGSPFSRSMADTQRATDARR